MSVLFTASLSTVTATDVLEGVSFLCDKLVFFQYTIKGTRYVYDCK
jgi:hypothetical protein